MKSIRWMCKRKSHWVWIE